ncbi:cytochrome P450 [Halioglobus maricola]|uniref:Cytochrome P450 n=1 Tax=Halioglobus maricola TaxID=2601894 RepID=A0A5P9NIK3_9GAMM|nr:cytochrome P450 [Halioglobus maricola]QFU75631.1 cytochrome P450 [Halioglobus maricola]
MPRQSQLDQDMSEWELPGLALHHFLDELRAEGPLAKIEYYGMPAYLVTSHDGLMRAFKDTVNLPPERAYQMGIAPLIGENFQSMSGERHRLYRKLATPTFRPRMVDKMDSYMMQEVADELIARFIDCSQTDMTRSFSLLYPYIVIARLLGIPRDEEEKFADWVVGLLHFTSEPERANRCRDELWAYLDPVIEERRRNPQDDVISQLIHDDVDGVKMDDALLKSHIGIMFSAGSSTTHDSIGNLLYALLSTGEWNRVRDNPDLRDQAIDEALRWEPAVSFLPRVTKAGSASIIEGVEIPADSFVFMGIASANHDASRFEDPHRFNIDREVDAKSMTFGHGPRMCPGMHLAKMNLRTTLDCLLERLPNLQLIESEGAAPSGTIFRHPAKLLCSF